MRGLRGESSTSDRAHAHPAPTVCERCVSGGDVSSLQEETAQNLRLPVSYSCPRLVATSLAIPFCLQVS
ncbi:hypothetical protein L1987_75307 [Smallanthus sonchifolius]|uniref:Uncharacterized protein n=1 Tax=Smallanthus sonchifolius TaxID=185202 RepID=A0ACB9A645_9ASTR|nr:hypothetical protein L1987_75307 [Smallanthus sonchifolius]